jgi:hypothetical protein
MRTAPLITTIPTQRGGQIFESADTTARGTLTEKDPTSTPAKAAHNWRTRSMRALGTLPSLARPDRGSPVEDRLRCARVLAVRRRRQHRASAPVQLSPQI